MKTQTAIEFLRKQYNENLKLTPIDFFQAKEMEKQQIIDAYWDGGQDIPLTSNKCNQYYNEIYKQEL